MLWLGGCMAAAAAVALKGSAGWRIPKPLQLWGAHKRPNQYLYQPDGCTLAPSSLLPPFPHLLYACSYTVRPYLPPTDLARESLMTRHCTMPPRNHHPSYAAWLQAVGGDEMEQFG